MTGQCGGLGDTCPLADKAKCVDAQYLSCAEPLSTCVRVNQW